MKTILIVEDERVIAEILSAVLEDEGYNVLIANNGRQGLERIAEKRPDLVLCDIMMPGLDGRDVARAMSADSKYRTIPLILMSAAHIPINRHDYPYTDFLRKPFDMDELIATVKRALNGSAPHHGH
ncbi:MAG TPA: response regulator [Chloroflexia bacterium]|nr:response regulator [Chloroflexia bacterium]